MSRLLMIESWVNANGVVLPLKIRQLGHDYVLMTRDAGRYARFSPIAEGHPVLTCAESVIHVETNDPEEVIASAVELHAREPFGGVISTCDYYLPLVARVARELGLAGTSPETMRVALQKHLVREACRRAGVVGPAFRAARTHAEALSFAREVGFPVIAKPVDLNASEKVSLVRDEAELRHAFDLILSEPTNSRGQARVPLVLLEAFVQGVELCVETLSHGGRFVVLGMSGKTLSEPPSFIELGSHAPAEISDEERASVADYARAVLTAIGYGHGLAHIEVRLTSEGPRLIELNPRMGGDYLFELYEHTSGVDIPALDVSLALGEPPRLPVPIISRGSAALECLLPPRAGRILRVEGATELAADSSYRRVSVKPVAGTIVQAPRDNSDFIGFVVAVDQSGDRARELARRGIARLKVVME